MVPLLLSSILMLAIAAHSNAAYCVCKQGMSEVLLQKNIDYACGAGADCNPILQNGPCYNPNTVQDHCNWAVNSYYQKKAQTTGSCDFGGTSTMSTTPPSQSSSCVYPASPGNGGITVTPTTNPGTSTTVNPTPSTSTGTGIGTGTGTSGTGIPGTTGGYGLAPSGTSFGGMDNTNSRGMTLQQTSNFPIAISLCIFIMVDAHNVVMRI